MNNRPAPFAAPTATRSVIAPEKLHLAASAILESSALHTQHWRIAWWLALATIGYNLAEGLFCTLFGYHDQSLTLFGFGLDSFIECISGFGLAHMVWRSPANHRDGFERRALRVDGWRILRAGGWLGSHGNLEPMVGPTAGHDGLGHVGSRYFTICNVGHDMAKRKNWPHPPFRSHACRRAVRPGVYVDVGHFADFQRSARTHWICLRRRAGHFGAGSIFGARGAGIF